MKRAIVMGATSGIGREVAVLLARRGWKVGVAGRRADRLDELVRQEENIIAGKMIDVTSNDAPQRLLELVDDMGGMNLYFHSSGVGWQNNELQAEKELKTVETNALGFTRMVTAAYQYFTNRQMQINDDSSDNGVALSESSLAHIACITSIAGTKGLGAAPAYSATKRFQNHYLECLEQQSRMRHLNIRFTDVRPGFVSTDLIAGSHYPLQLEAGNVARSIVRAIEKGRAVVTIDDRYRLLVALWRMVPRWLWVRLRISR